VIKDPQIHKELHYFVNHRLTVKETTIEKFARVADIHLITNFDAELNKVLDKIEHKGKLN